MKPFHALPLVMLLSLSVGSLESRADPEDNDPRYEGQSPTFDIFKFFQMHSQTVKKPGQATGVKHAGVKPAVVKPAVVKPEAVKPAVKPAKPLASANPPAAVPTKPSPVKPAPVKPTPAKPDPAPVAAAPSEEDMPTPAPASSGSTAGLPAPLWGATDARVPWTLTVRDVVSKRISDLEQAKDKEAYCPGYSKANAAQRVNCWVMLVSAVSKFESGFKTGDAFREPDGNSSIGLLALSPGECPNASSAKALAAPKSNLTCGVNMMAKLIAKDHFIDGPADHRGASKYWSTLRAPYKRWDPTRNRYLSLGYKTQIEAMVKNYRGKVEVAPVAHAPAHAPAAPATPSHEDATPSVATPSVATPTVTPSIPSEASASMAQAMEIVSERDADLGEVYSSAEHDVFDKEHEQVTDDRDFYEPRD